MTTEFENKIQDLQDRLRVLPARSVAIFSASCAERLAVYYEQFTTKNGWDCYPTVRRILDLCWDVLLGQDNLRDELKVHSAQLLQYVPHGDNFTGILCTGAQDFAACIESAIKWIFVMPNARYGVVYYAVEVLHAAATLSRLGKPFVDDADKWANDSSIIKDPAIRKEFGAQADDLTILERNARVTDQDARLIRKAAVENRHILGMEHGT